MKIAKVTIEIPLPDEATQKDAETLAKLIARVALTKQPYDGATPGNIFFTNKVFGTVTKVKLHDA
jgi:hypothetical protein